MKYLILPMIMIRLEFGFFHFITSPSKICVALSTPVLAGMNNGDGGRSKKASV